jgi:hypothetical protein
MRPHNNFGATSSVPAFAIMIIFVIAIIVAFFPVTADEEKALFNLGAPEGSKLEIIRFSPGNYCRSGAPYKLVLPDGRAQIVCIDPYTDLPVGN